MEAIILAAGYGTRLYEQHPEAKNKPKGLFTYNDKPAIEYTVDSLIGNPDISRITLVTNDRFFTSFRDWKMQYDSKQDTMGKLFILNDKSTNNDNRLGSIGDLKYAIDMMRINQDILVVASDYAFLIDFKKLIEYQKQLGKSITLAVQKPKEQIANKNGNILIDENNKVIELIEKPANPISDLASIACYIISKNDFKYINECAAQKQDATGYLFEKIVKDNELYSLIMPRKEIISIDQLVKNG